MIRRLAAALALSLAAALPARGEPEMRLLDFADLDGWAADDHAAALETFRVTCGDLDAPDWRTLCRLAGEARDARAFFELFFTPVQTGEGEAGLFTGYFEPELEGARAPDARYRYPIYRVPPDLGPDEPWLSRREIEEGQVLSGRGLEIAWVEDPVALFFLQVQGSGRIRLPDGEILRVGYGGANRRPYSSVGEELVARGVYAPHEVSASVIADWVDANPEDGRELLWTNESYVFFRELESLPPEAGPLGAMNRPLTPMRSLAVDPGHAPLGAPVWLETRGAAPMRRLMVAQDTGSAIRGTQRGDVFFGTGDAAGRAAGRMRDPGRMVVLLPIQRAHALLPDRIE